MATPPVLRVVEREARVFARLWRGVVFSHVPQPGAVPRRDGPRSRRPREGAHRQRRGPDAISTSSRPGLLVASAMQLAASEAMWPVLGGGEVDARTSTATVATSITPGELVRRLRAVDRAPRRCSARPRSCSSPRCSARSRRRGGCSRSRPPRCARPRSARRSPRTRSGSTATSSFPVIMRVGVLPLFLFSGTFFPISQLPGWLRPLARALAAVARRRAGAGTRPRARCTSGADVVHVAGARRVHSAPGCCGAGARSRGG